MNKTDKTRETKPEAVVPKSPLNFRTVKKIRKRHKNSDITQKELAKEYGISHSCVNDIVNRVTWDIEESISEKMKDSEKWIPEYKYLYTVNKKGDVFTWRRNEKESLEQKETEDGYKNVVLYKNGKRKMFQVHRLVLRAFVGEPEENEECRHLNGHPSDNRLQNLKWGTHKENMQDAIRHEHSNFPPNSNK